MKKILSMLLVLSILSACFGALADDLEGEILNAGYTLSGHIYDQMDHEKIMDNIKITLTNGETSIENTVLVNTMKGWRYHTYPSHEFLLEGISAGSWTMHLSRVGYYDTEIAIEMPTTDFEIPEDIYMIPKGPITPVTTQVYYIGNSSVLLLLNEGTLCDAKKNGEDGIVATSIKSLVGNGLANSEDGTLISCGIPLRYPKMLENEKNVKKVIYTEFNEAIVLREDGTVAKYNSSNQNGVELGEDWTNIIDIIDVKNLVYSSGYLGVKADGTIVADRYTSRHYSNILENWSHIVSLSCIADYTVGIQDNGTIVRFRDDIAKEDWFPYMEMLDWEDLVKVVGNDSLVVGLRSDGTVYCCYTSDSKKAIYDVVSQWSDIVDIYQSTLMGDGIVGIKSDGTIVTAGRQLVDDLVNRTGIKTP